MGKIDAPCVAFGRVEVQSQAAAWLQHDFSARDAPNAQLGPLQVKHNAYRPPGVAFGSTDDAQARGMVVMGAMAEIQPEDVGARLDQRAYAFGAGA